MPALKTYTHTHTHPSSGNNGNTGGIQNKQESQKQPGRVLQIMAPHPLLPEKGTIMYTGASNAEKQEGRRKKSHTKAD